MLTFLAPFMSFHSLSVSLYLINHQVFFIEVTNFPPNPSGNLSVLFEIILHIFSIIAGFKSNFIPTIEIFEAIRTSKWIGDVGLICFRYLLFRFLFLALWISASSNNHPNFTVDGRNFVLIQNGENVRGFRCVPVV